MQILKAHSKPVYSLAFSPCGRFLLTSSGDETVRLWEWRGAHEIGCWPGSQFWSPVAYSPNGRFIARGGYSIAVWPVSTDSVVMAPPAPAKQKRTARKTAEQTETPSPSPGETAATSELRAISGPPVVNASQFTEAIAFAPDSRSFFGHGNSGAPMQRWSLPRGEPLACGWGGVRTDAKFPTGALACRPDGGEVAAVFGVYQRDRYESTAILWNPQSGQERGRLMPAKSVPAHATQLAYSHDGTLLAGVYGPILIIWDLANQRELARGITGKKHFKGLAFNPRGASLLTASNDKTIGVWSGPKWEQTGGFDWDIGRLGCVAISADGAVAAAGSERGKVILWDLD